MPTDPKPAPAGRFDTLLQESAADPPGDRPPDPSDDRPPDPPGFRLLDEVGRGGMGVVYRARDLTLDRDVAVKVLRPGCPPESLTARRFKEEARVTAGLQHPGIPPVYHVGTLSDGRPFLAMKLIRGNTLETILKNAPDRDRLVGHFEKMCEAVGYAHSKGVIHRDLKPANIMVGDYGEVQVMDWGLSKLLGDDAHPPAATGSLAGHRTELFHTPCDSPETTRAGSVMGTPAYMAPEQALGEVARMDARTDVFGLGAVLCTILTGRPPFVGEDVFSTQMLAAQAELADAHARLDGCGADPEVVALCKRCLAADRDARPANAGEVAATVVAIRAEAADRLRRAETAEAVNRGRRRAFAVAGGVVMLVLAAGAGVSGWQAVRATDAEKATASQLKLTQDAESAARQAAEEARAAERLAVQEGERARSEGVKARQEEAKAKASEANAKASETRAKTEETKAREAEATAVAERERAKVEEGKARAAAELARRREAEAKEAAADTEAFSSFLTGKILAAARPAGQQGGVGKDAKLSDALRAAETDLDKQFAGRPKAEAAARHALGVTWRNLGEYDRAVTHLTRAVELRRQVLPANHPDTLTSISSLSVLYQLRGDPTTAEKLAREALDGRRATLPATDRAVLTSVNNLALLLRQRGNVAAAEPLLKEAVDGRRKALGDTDPDTLASIGNLATLYLEKKELEKAEPLLTEAVAGMRAKVGPTNPDTLLLVHNLAELRTRQGKYDDAEPLHREAVAGCRQSLPDGHPLTLTCLAGLGQQLLARKRYADAVPPLREAVAGYDKRPALARESYPVRADLGRSLLGDGKPAEAEPHLKAAYAGLQTDPKQRDRLQAVVRGLIDVYTTTKRPAEAAEWRAKLSELPP